MGVAGACAAFARVLGRCTLPVVEGCAKCHGVRLVQSDGSAMPKPSLLPPPADQAPGTPRSAFAAASASLVAALNDSVRREGELTNKLVAAEAAKAKDADMLAAYATQVMALEEEIRSA